MSIKDTTEYVTKVVNDTHKMSILSKSLTSKQIDSFFSSSVSKKKSSYYDRCVVDVVVVVVVVGVVQKL